MSAFLHPFAPPSMAEADFRTIVRAEGVWLWDADGNRYLDGIANLWNCHVGHGRAEIVDAVATQLRTLDAYNTFAPFTNEPAGALADEVAARSPHPDGRVFLANSGSEAIDTAIKLVRMVQTRRFGPGKQLVLTRARGYHGTNYGGTTAQGLPPNKEGWGDLVPHFVALPADDIEAASRIFAEHDGAIAAVLTEPVQGAGGVFPPSEGYLEGLRRLCDQHDALLVFDEVITGFGRTGDWFAKGVTSGYQPLSGVILSAATAAELVKKDVFLRTGYTYSGHPAACAAGLANIAIIDREGLPARAAAMARTFDEGLGALAADGLIADHRGTGAIWAAELGRDAAPVRDALLAEGVVGRPIGTALAFCPPLTITDEQLGEAFDRLAAVLGRTA